MLKLTILYLAIHIFIKNSDINLNALYELGFAFLVLFMFFNFKKYQLISNIFNKVQYLIETGLSFNRYSTDVFC